MDTWILVVDSEPEIADLVEVYLKGGGCIVFRCGTNTEAPAVVRNQVLDLTILDVMPPDISGLTLREKIRKEYHFPVLMLTVKAESMNKTAGFTIDAGDYITKPFSPLELITRAKIQLHHYIRCNETDKIGNCRDIIGFSGLVINQATHKCTFYDRELDLAPTEFDILRMFCENRGQVIFAKRFLESMWGEKYLDRSNMVMIHIHRLREKMGELSRDPRFVKTA